MPDFLGLALGVARRSLNPAGTDNLRASYPCPNGARITGIGASSTQATGGGGSDEVYRVIAYRTGEGNMPAARASTLGTQVPSDAIVCADFIKTNGSGAGTEPTTRVDIKVQPGENFVIEVCERRNAAGATADSLQSACAYGRYDGDFDQVKIAR